MKFGPRHTSKNNCHSLQLSICLKMKASSLLQTRFSDQFAVVAVGPVVTQYGGLADFEFAITG